MKQTKKIHIFSRLPLKYKLSIYFILFSGVMLVFLWVFQTAFLEVCYEGIRHEQVKYNAVQISQSIKHNRDTTSLINRICKNNEISMSIYDSTHEIIIPGYSVNYSTPNNQDVFQMHQAYNYYRLARENGGRYITTSMSNDSKSDGTSHYDADENEINPVKNMVYAEIITLSNNRECLLLVSGMITPVTAVINTLRIQLVILSIVFVILALVLATVVSRHISKPIVEMNTQVKELAQKNYNVRFQGDGYLEVKELSNTLNKTREELKRAEVLQQELIANISHDLRTPLTMITGYGEVIRDLPGENTPENIQVIIDEANRLTTLVNDMLDLSKLKSGKIEIDREIYSLTESIEDIFTRYAKLREQEGYNIKFIADKNAFVNADPVKIGQVIYNFINNAINHCGNDKTVIVTQKVYMNKVRIEVEDHGEGIDQDKIEYIWDRYYKVDKKHKRDVIGTGLGLSIVKNILELHNARFGVRSKVNQGSVFWFELRCETSEPLKPKTLP